MVKFCPKECIGLVFVKIPDRGVVPYCNWITSQGNATELCTESPPWDPDSNPDQKPISWAVCPLRVSPRYLMVSPRYLNELTRRMIEKGGGD